MSIEPLLFQFANNRQDAIHSYIDFVKCGIGIKIWDDLQHQVFLDDNEFVDKYQVMLNEQCGDLSKMPLKQRSATPKILVQYEQEANNKHEAIVKAYQSGCYTQKQIADYFGLHYS